MISKLGLLAAASALAMVATPAFAQVDPGAPQASTVNRGLITAPSTPVQTPGEAPEVVVTAQRLDAARASIEPSLGASTYTLNAASIEAQPGGANQQFNQVILQLPGVTQDSFGQFHVRDDHNGIQYRFNGIILPEGISVFGQTLSTRLVDSFSLITGALPAQYGLQTAGIVDVTTKTGIENGGRVTAYGGSHGDYEPSFEYGGHSGNTDSTCRASTGAPSSASRAPTAPPPPTTTAPTKATSSSMPTTSSPPRTG